ncbi:MAG: YkgJ family cysteine cluster protein [Bacteroidota bacterium]
MNDPYGLSSLKSRADARKKENKKLAAKIKTKHNRNVDNVVHQLHEEAFEHIDCLNCGNCCKTISPIVTDHDISRISRKLKMKPSAFVEKYLRMDDEDDYVFRQTPCPFLGDDNYCAIYADRPKACADYPHTNRPKFKQALDISLKNTRTCPAVYEIFEKLRYIEF